MSIEFPSVAEVRAALQPFTLKQIDRLGALAGVPPTTIYKIKRGETKDPGMDTVRKFWPLLDEARTEPQPDAPVEPRKKDLGVQARGTLKAHG